MPTSRSERDSPSSDWERIIRGIETALADSIAQSEGRAAALAGDDALDGLAIDIRNFSQPLVKLQGCLRRAEQRTGEIDEFLRKEQAAARKWIGTVESLRQKLATWESDTL